MSRRNAKTAGKPAAAPRRTWAAWITWIATTDHCPWANPYVYWLKSPLGVLILAAFCSLLCGLFIAPQGYAVLAAITGVVLLGMAWPWLAMRGIVCRIVFVGQRGREDQAAQAKLVITNRWPWPVWGLAVENPLENAAEPVDYESLVPSGAVALARISGWSRSTFNCSFTTDARGLYPKQEVRIGTGFPFGLYRASRPATVPRRLIVWPRTFWLPPLTIGQARRHWSGTLSDLLTGSEGTRHGVRVFRPGDELRDVHWAKSARHDELIVSEREATTVQRLTVIVDTDPWRHAGVGRDSSLEWSLRIAASICESVAAQQGGVDLWLGGDRHAADGPAALERLLDAIAEFDVTRAKPNVGASGRSTRNGGGAAVSIGADASPIRCERSIVLHAAGFGAGGPATADVPAGWIEVASPEDVPGQVLRGWRLGHRRLCRA